MTKTAKRQLKKNNTKKMKGGGLFGNAPVAPSSETEPKTQEPTSTVFSRLTDFFKFNKKTDLKIQEKPQSNTQQQQPVKTSETPTLTGGRRRNTKKATRKAKKGGRIAKKGARKANKSRRTRK